MHLGDGEKVTKYGFTVEEMILVKRTCFIVMFTYNFQIS